MYIGDNGPHGTMGPDHLMDDREAIRTTVSLLAEHDRQLVIFPEGEIYGHNDLLLPFQSGL